jgi:hypothetical protein
MYGVTPGSDSHWAFAIVIRNLEQVYSCQVILAGWPASVFELSKSKKGAGGGSESR